MSKIIPEMDDLLKFQFEKPSVKRSITYGKRIAKMFWDEVGIASNSYYRNRNQNWETNQQYADGKVSHDEFFSLLNIQGARSFINLDPTIVKILPKYKQALIGGWMDRDEVPTVKATDVISSETKEREKFKAKFRMQNKETITQLEEAAGHKLAEGFTPENEAELDVYYKTRYRLPEEAFFEKSIRQILSNNDYQNLKRTLLSDAIVKNFMCVKLETINANSKTLTNRFKLKRCKPDRCFYNVFESPIGEDISFIGEVYPVTIAEARRRFPKTTEEQWFEIAKVCQKGLKLAEPLSWQDSYINSVIRPYDDYNFLILDFEYKSLDKEYYVKTENQYGNTILVDKKAKPVGNVNSEMKGEAIDLQRFNIYCGSYAIDTNVMLDWDIAENMIRPYQNGIDVFFNYSVVIPENDGKYQLSLIERCIPNVREMVVCKLKINQMIALMKAEGVSIDVAGLDKVTLGNGESYSRLEVKKIYDQRGEVWWDSSDTTGTGLDGQRNPPITNLPNNGNIGQINTLIQNYNFALQNLNDELGVNNDFLGQAVAAKRGARVSDNQIQAANKATEYLYDYYLMLLSQVCTKIGYKLWDMLILESVDYKEMSGFASDLIDTTFDINLEMSSKSQEKTELLELISIALEKGYITLSQSYEIKNMEIKDAVLYLNYVEERASKAQQQSQQQSIEGNAQVQERSLMARAKADAMVEEAIVSGKKELDKQRIDGEAYLEITKMLKELGIKSMENRTPIPAEFKPLFDAYLQNITNQSIVKPAKEEEVARLEAEQQQLMQEQQQPQI